MKNFLILFLLFCFAKSFSQIEIESIPLNASHEVGLKISKLEKCFANGEHRTMLDRQIVNQLVCITGITPKVANGDYIGISFNPSIQEIRQMRIWYESNKTKISYDNNKTIIVEFEKGKFRKANCHD